MNRAESEIRIVGFRRELAPYFKSINEQWIREMFELEPADRAILDAPERMVITPGGKIWFAEHHSLGVIGTCALLKKSEGIFELTKMGVLEKARGLKAGEALLRHVLENACEMEIVKLFLLTNRVCEPAIHLYYKFGFRDDAQIMQDY